MNFFIERFGANGFLGEHLWLGHVGHFLVIFGFFAAILSFFAYASFERTKDHVWQKIGRFSFIVHSSTVFGIFILLFVMILNHWFEYHYAWRHSSQDLPMKYIISSFWEGQEGSFLLWEFWGAVLGLILLKTAKEWEGGVMTVVGLTQAFLGSMLLGVYVFGYKIGSNPFILLRNEMAEAPIFQRLEYLTMIADGNGLNPLLQNYWMTIHPPVLFLGFASTLIPCAYVFASLWRKDFTGWVKPALPWALFNMAILGTGILMGGAWAYEALSFGGFWAWDPVENMSFVPWLLIVAGLHLHLVYRYTGHGIFSTFLFYILGWLMVLYSTFLTRSGILGDTSVHAFTDLGMSGQLIIYGIAYLVPAVALMAFRYPAFPKMEKEEPFFSREFWMFVGALLLLLSAVQMTFTTSIPVWNKVFGTKLAPPADVVSHYNSIQLWIGLFVAIFTAKIQFLAYKSSKIPSGIKWLTYSAAIAVVLAAFIAWGCDIKFMLPIAENISFLSPYFLFLFASVFAVVANLSYLIFIIKGKWSLSGGSVTHFGFGLFLVGVLISQHKKEVVSINTRGDNFGKGFDDKELVENVLLMKDSIYKMSGYDVTYIGRTDNKHEQVFNVNYRKFAKDGKSEVENFTLTPNIVRNKKMGDSPNPSTKHYLSKDVFTHVTAASDNSNAKDTTIFSDVAVGDTFFLNKYYVVFESINPHPDVEAQDKDKLAVQANLKVGDLKGNVLQATPVFFIDVQHDNETSSHAFESEQWGVSFDIARINPETKQFSFVIHQKELQQEFIILKAIVFPYINLVWLGGIITFLGIFISAWRRRN